MTTRTLSLITAATLALVALSGCSADLPTLPDVPGIDSSSPGAAPFDPTADYNEVYLDSLEGTQVSFADWKSDWDEAGCTPELAAEDKDCSMLVTSGGMLVDGVQIMLQALAPEGGSLGELDGTRDAAAIAYESSLAFANELCGGELIPECAPYAVAAASDILALHAEFATWSR